MNTANDPSPRARASGRAHRYRIGFKSPHIALQSVNENLSAGAPEMVTRAGYRVTFVRRRDVDKGRSRYIYIYIYIYFFFFFPLKYFVPAEYNVKYNVA